MQNNRGWNIYRTHIFYYDINILYYEYNTYVLSSLICTQINYISHDK